MDMELYRTLLNGFKPLTEILSVRFYAIVKSGPVAEQITVGLIR